MSLVFRFIQASSAGGGTGRDPAPGGQPLWVLRVSSVSNGNGQEASEDPGRSQRAGDPGF